MNEVIEDKTYITAAKAASELFNYGDLITKNWLLESFKLSEPETGTRKDFEEFAFKFLAHIEGFKTEMLESYTMHIISVRGEGYRIVMPSQQTDAAVSKLRKVMASEMKKAVNVMMFTNESHMQHDDIRRRDDMLGKVAALRAFNKNMIGN